MVLLQQIKHIIKIAHLLANEERLVPSFDLLVRHHCVSHLFNRSLTVLHSCQLVIAPTEHSEWNRVARNINFRWQFSPIFFLVLLCSIVILLEPLVPDNLRVVQDLLLAATSWVVAPEVDLESLLIIKLGLA